MIKLRQSVGITSALDVAKAEVAKASIQAQHAQAKNQQSSYYAILQLLVGASVSDAIKDNRQITQHTLTLTVPETLNSEVLLNRPDIIASEEALYAANANIGEARAAFFPTINLASSAGFASADLNDLFSSDSKTWSFLPAISIPLFGSSLEARLDLSIARKNKTVAEYEKAIQTAFSEVYTHFQGRKSLEKEIIAQNRLVKAQRKRLNLATSRYDAGLTSYIEVLDGQQDLFSAEQALLVAQRNALTTTIQLYKALGGGDEANHHFR